MLLGSGPPCAFNTPGALHVLGQKPINLTSQFYICSRKTCGGNSMLQTRRRGTRRGNFESHIWERRLSSPTHLPQLLRGGAKALEKKKNTHTRAGYTRALTHEARWTHKHCVFGFVTKPTRLVFAWVKRRRCDQTQTNRRYVCACMQQRSSPVSCVNQSRNCSFFCGKEKRSWIKIANKLFIPGVYGQKQSAQNNHHVGPDWSLCYPTLTHQYVHLNIYCQPFVGSKDPPWHNRDGKIVASDFHFPQQFSVCLLKRSTWIRAINYSHSRKMGQKVFKRRQTD